MMGVAPLVLASVSALAALPPHTVTKTQVTSDINPQYDPAVSDGKVAWTDYNPSTGLSHISVYDIPTATYTTLTVDTASNQNLADISGTTVVYTDSRHGNLDIFAFDLLTGIETPIVTDPANQLAPAIRGTRIAWEDNRGPKPNIWAWDGAVATAVSPNNSFPQAHPAVSGNTVVWADLANGVSFNIWKADLATPGSATAVTHNTTFNCQNPDIDGNYAVYECDAGGISQIYATDLLTGTQTQVTAAAASQKNPKISGTFVVWEDYTHGATDADLQGWDLRTAQGSTLADGPSNQRLHDLSGFDVAYTDNVAGNDDIYVLHVTLTTPPSTSDPCDPASGAPLLFDETFLRERGRPHGVTRTFTAPTGMINGTICLSLDRVAAAKVIFNGTGVFGPSDFNATVTSLSKNVTLVDSNTLSLLLLGKPHHGETETGESRGDGHDALHETNGHHDGHDLASEDHPGNDNNDDDGDDDHDGPTEHPAGGGAMRVRVVGPTPAPAACDMTSTATALPGAGAALTFLLAGIAVTFPRRRR